MPSLSQVEGWHAPAGRRTCEPRPLAQARQIRPAAPVGARSWARPTDRSQDSPSGVGRFGGQAGTQASDPTPVPGQNLGSRAGSTIHILPAEYLLSIIGRVALAEGLRTSQSVSSLLAFAVTSMRHMGACAS